MSFLRGDSGTFGWFGEVLIARYRCRRLLSAAEGGSIFLTTISHLLEHYFYTTGSAREMDLGRDDIWTDIELSMVKISKTRNFGLS